jgi:hypothetical protein
VKRERTVPLRSAWKKAVHREQENVRSRKFKNASTREYKEPRRKLYSEEGIERRSRVGQISRVVQRRIAEPKDSKIESISGKLKVEAHLCIKVIKYFLEQWLQRLEFSLELRRPFIRYSIALNDLEN